MINKTDLEAFEYYNREAQGELKFSDSTPLDLVRHYMKVMGQPLNVDYNKHSGDLLEALRFKLIREEADEVSEAYGDLELLKELADLVYVTYGFAATYGWDLDEAVRRVHENNMGRCVQPDGTVRYREDGKVMKNESYPKVNLEDLV